ncbi:nuclear transport factor 2 family protein [Bacillus spongiae]|uniref:Nuclear transport factor 2 family protein n=1 Tax=Bacillus spongiae TaxID=2683610 RepID=A0ABU8HCH8_9BACI
MIIGMEVIELNCKEALAKYIEATNTHDFQKVQQVLHPQAIYWFTNQSCSSMEEIQRYFEYAWGEIKDEVYSISNVNWVSMNDRSATCLYTYHYQGYNNGKLVSGSGRATNVFVKTEDNYWKLIHEHLSKPMV